jgi:hypothetical protein
MAPIALDAAPKANNMVKLRNTPRGAAHHYTAISQQAPCHDEKPNEIAAFESGVVGVPRQ